MLLQIPTETISHKLKSFDASERRGFKVSVVGATGNVGAPTMMLLKMNPLVSRLVGIDRKSGIMNLANDLSQINFPAKVSGYMVTSKLDEALWDSKLVIHAVNSIPITPGTTSEDMFRANATFIQAFAELASTACPDACFMIVTNPVNSMVPLFCKIMENRGTLNPNKVFGMCNLGSIRAASYIAELKGLDPRNIKCPVIGGNSPTTTIPVLSKVTPRIEFTTESLHILARNIQKVKNKLIDTISPTSTMATAYATASLADSILRGLKGEPLIKDHAFVKSNIVGTRFFTSSLIFGKGGIERNLGLPQLSKFEESLLQTCIVDLSKEVARGEELFLRSEDVIKKI